MDAKAIVAHPYASDARLFHVDANGLRAGVQAVFQQLLDDGGRALDNLAGRDLIGDELAQGANAAASAQLPPPPPNGISKIWPTRIRSLDKLFTARKRRIETRLRWAISESVSPRLIT